MQCLSKSAGQEAYFNDPEGVISQAETGVHGVAGEDEDIQTHILDFDAAMALVTSGEADNGPLLLSLFWLAANRAGLRADASAA